MERRLLERLKAMLGGDESSGDTDVSYDAAERRVLLVCMGNICRTPTAEGVLRKALHEHASDLSVYVDSAGTHAFHIGQPPDPRARRAAERRGIDLSSLRARQVEVEDFERFDIILAMDRQNEEILREQADAMFHDRIRLFLSFAQGLAHEEVPDPYYGGLSGFELVLDLAEEASLGLIEHLRKLP